MIDMQSDNDNAPTLTAERVRALLVYEPETGTFTWRVTNSNRALAGTVAGSDCHGYSTIRVDGKLHRAHRLAWLITHGSLPPYPAFEIDHINMDRSDNRIANLRLATRFTELR